MGSDILSVRQIRKLGAEAVLERIPAGARYYVTIDIDGFDPSIAPGTGTPSHGGFLYYEVLELLAGLAKRGTVVGIDLVEVAPDYDHSGTTAILAAQVLLNFIGRVLHARAGGDRRSASSIGATRSCFHGPRPAPCPRGRKQITRSVLSWLSTGLSSSGAPQHEVVRCRPGTLLVSPQTRSRICSAPPPRAGQRPDPGVLHRARDDTAAHCTCPLAR